MLQNLPISFKKIQKKLNQYKLESYQAWKSFFLQDK